MRWCRALILLVGVAIFTAPAYARHLHGSGSGGATPGCPKGVGLTDLGGTADDCASATQNPSYQNVNFFSTGAGNARQSNQAAYFYNDNTLPYNVSCVDNGCGYNTATATDDPANISFSASSGTVASGVLTVSDANLSATGGNIAVGQYIGTGGVAATTSSPKTVSLTSHTGGVQVWQLDQNVTVAGTPTITGTRYPQLNVFYSSTGTISANTTSDTTTPTSISHYDMSMHGGMWFNLTVGSGGGSSGVAGDLTLTDNHWLCNPTTHVGGINVAINTHFNITISHSEFDGNYPAQSGCNATNGFGAQIFLLNSGTDASHKINIDIEWNYSHNQATDAWSGLGDYSNKTIAHNAFMGFNLDPATPSHGAVFADSARNPRGSYIYKQNICLYPSSAPANLGTTCYSFLADATNYRTAPIDDAEALGNIAISNCTSLPCDGSTNDVVQTTLWQFVDPPQVNTFVSKGNLVDRTGGLGGASSAAFHGGLSRNKDTCKQDANVAAHNTTITCTAKNDAWFKNSIVHVNNTPFTFNGTITYNNDNATATMVLDGAGNSGIAAGNGIAGILVPPGLSIQTKNSNTNFTLVNYNCSYTTSCVSADLTAPHQAMYSACHILAMGTIDPVTGLASTGTGTNTGTYISDCVQTDGSRSTYQHYNPAITNYPPTVNAGNDYDIITGSPLCLGGVDWSSGFCP